MTTDDPAPREPRPYIGFSSYADDTPRDDLDRGPQEERAFEPPFGDADTAGFDPPADELRLAPPDAVGGRPRRRAGGVLLIAGAATAGAAIWALQRADLPQALGWAQAPTARAMSVRPAAPLPAPAPAPPPPEPAAPQIEAETAPPPAAQPPTVRLAKAEAEPERAAPRPAACARSTPADRLVCDDLALQLFDLKLRDAYAHALNARADPAVVGEDQAAWRRARDRTADPRVLARLYDRRIRELDAASAAARQPQPAE